MQLILRNTCCVHTGHGIGVSILVLFINKGFFQYFLSRFAEFHTQSVIATIDEGDFIQIGFVQES